MRKLVNFYSAIYSAILAFVFITIPIANVSAAPEFKNQQSYNHSETGVSLISAELSLPSKGSWRLDSIENTSLSDVSLIVPEIILQRNLGTREIKKRERNEQNKQRSLIYSVNSELENFARKNEGLLPDTLEALKQSNRLKDKDISKIFLVPDSTILTKKGTRWNRVKTKEPLLIELNPLFNNNKHWVVYSNGRAELIDIEKALLTKYGIKTQYQKVSVSEQLKTMSGVVDYRLIARLKDKSKTKSAKLHFKNTESGETLDKQWLAENNQAQDPELLKLWATQRLSNWHNMLKNGQEGYLPYWFEAGLRQYELSRKDITIPSDFRRAFRRDASRSTSLFSILGGRSAIQETLQLQQLNADKSETNQRDISIHTVKGVTVKSHPFEEMLAGSKGGSLTLANSVPADRFFAWFAKPKDLTKYLNGGSDFIFNSGSTLLGKSNNSFLEERYLNKLGVDASWMKKFFEQGAVSELAVVLPDLYLLDGTDLSIVMQLKQPDVVKGLLSLLGVDAGSQIFTYKHAHGESYWTMQNNLLVVSTNLNEIKSINELMIGEDKTESLGQSAEFKYMLTQLPIEQRTHSFFYFSDPFIRHLVSPQVKLAQLRRIQARTEMEGAAAASLLYKANGNSEKTQPSLESLVSNKYLLAPVIVEDLVLLEDGTVTSKTWGTPADMPSLLDQPVTLISRSEKEAYKFYLDNYNRFWRRFFDPIAIRLNQETDQQMEVSTFILPLINNSIYEQLRAIVVSDDKEAKPLKIPLLEPKPVAQLSLNLNKELWKENADDFAQEFLEKIVGIPARVMDFIGPDVHLALADSDPILVMGSGGLAGSLGMFNGRRGGMSMMLPLAGSLFTRPSALMISLTDPEAVKAILHDVSNSTKASRRNRSFGSSELYGTAGKDAWLYSLNIEGLIGMRFGIEIQDSYLIITNQPMSFNPKISGYDKALNNGAALTLSPKSAVKQRPALHASANEQRLKAALSGINLLYPYMLSGTETIEAAKSKVKAEFGYEPKHPGKGKWEWQNSQSSNDKRNHQSGQMVSTIFGNHKRKLLAEYEADEEFGLLREVEDVNINMQFEDDGLRARVLWNLAK